MPKNYFSLNQVPIGTKVMIKETKEEGELVEIQNFPTTFIITLSNGMKNSYLTHEVEIIGWPKES